MPMFSSYILLLLMTLVVIFTGGLLWSLRRLTQQKFNAPQIDTHRNLHLWLLVLATFIMVLFITYALFTLPPPN